MIDLSNLEQTLKNGQRMAFYLAVASDGDMSREIGAVLDTQIPAFGTQNPTNGSVEIFGCV